jgi:hypothetical protein
MADFHFEGAESWPELAEAHARWLTDYNAQKHWAHRERSDGRRSPEEVLGWLTGVRYRDEDLDRAFFCTRHTRKLDALGYARFATGGSTPRKPSPAEKRPCGSSPRP